MKILFLASYQYKASFNTGEIYKQHDEIKLYDIWEGVHKGTNTKPCNQNGKSCNILQTVGQGSTIVA